MWLKGRKEKCLNCQAEIESLFVISIDNGLDTEWYFECPQCRSLFKSIHATNHVARNVLFFFLSFFLSIVFIVSTAIFIVHLRADGLVFNIPLFFSSLFMLGCLSGLWAALKNYKKHAYGQLVEIDNQEYERKVKVSGERGGLITHSRGQATKEIIKILTIMVLCLIFLNYKYLLGL